MIHKSNIRNRTVSYTHLVGAVIASVVFEMAAGVLKERKITLVIIMLISFIVTYFFNINVIYVILVCIGIGLIQTFMRKKVDEK